MGIWVCALHLASVENLLTWSSVCCRCSVSVSGWSMWLCLGSFVHRQKNEIFNKQVRKPREPAGPQVINAPIMNLPLHPFASCRFSELVNLLLLNKKNIAYLKCWACGVVFFRLCSRSAVVARWLAVIVAWQMDFPRSCWRKTLPEVQIFSLQSLKCGEKGRTTGCNA